MNRRDTIIIAILVNTGLLAVLFMMAINSNDEDVIEQPKTIRAPLELSQMHPISETIAVNQKDVDDELDIVLKDYSILNAASNDAYDELTFEPSFVEKNKNAITSQIALQDKSSIPSTKIIEITVKKGDSLDKIARTNATTVEAIKKASNLSADRLYIGQVLQVPIHTETRNMTKKTSEAAQPLQSEAQFYTIKGGDNPWKIAKQFQVKYDELLKLNNLDEDKARKLKVGDQIRVK